MSLFWKINHTLFPFFLKYPDCREILLPMMTDQLKYHLERQEDLEACCQLLSNILEVLYRKDVVRNLCTYTTLQSWKYFELALSYSKVVLSRDWHELTYGPWLVLKWAGLSLWVIIWLVNHQWTCLFWRQFIWFISMVPGPDMLAPMSHCDSPVSLNVFGVHF